MPSAPVRVILPGMLRDLVGGVAEIEVESPSESQTVAELHVDLDGATPLRGVLDAATTDRPRLGVRMRDETGALRRHVNVFVDGEDAKRADGVRTEVGPQATVHVINAVSGG